MNRLQKTLLLLGLQAQCRADREQDWQSLHRRDREWFLQQPKLGRWQLARAWLSQFSGKQPWITWLSPMLVLLLGLLIGAGLMSGLLQFQPQQRINLWWLMLFAIWLPALWWLVSLWLSRSSRCSIWSQGLLRKLPQSWRADASLPLLGLTAQMLAQRFALGVGLGLLGSFLLHLVLTDLAFGWSSTLSLSAPGVQRLLAFMAWPWQAWWPEAVPSLSLVEQTRFFRIEQTSLNNPELAGHWWRFLLMNLLVYVLLPRLASFVWAESRLASAHLRLLTQDACLDGWWQRLHAELVRQKGAPAPLNQPPPATSSRSLQAQPEASAAAESWPPLAGIIAPKHWPPEQLTSQLQRLPPNIQALPRIDPQQAKDKSHSGKAYLLICKGWEPPTGALADLCQQLHERGQRIYLWPAQLPGMTAQRAHSLRESWRLFVPQLPDSCHLLDPDSHA